jgi:hypothetical protein
MPDFLHRGCVRAEGAFDMRTRIADNGGAPSQTPQPPNADDEGSHGLFITTVDSAFPGCAPLAERLRVCQKSHPPRSPTAVACDKFGVLLGWCVARQLCEKQTGKLEQCCGGIPEIVKCSLERCGKEAAALDACMARFT